MPAIPVSVCAFDAYGTLFDVHSALRRNSGGLDVDKAAALSELWRRKQLEYTWLRSLMRRYVDFAQITADALDYAMQAHGVDGVDSADLRSQWLDLYLRLDIYPEVADVLSKLRKDGMRLAILSNGTPDMLAAAVDHAGLTNSFEAILSVETVRQFKPDPLVYRLVGDHFGCMPDHVAFMSSNAWDMAAGADYGFHTFWINRFNQPPERLPGTPEHQLSTLEPLPNLVTTAPRSA